MVFYLKLYFATLISFFVIDMVWLGLVARTLYSKYLGFLLATSTNWPSDPVQLAVYRGHFGIRCCARAG